MDVIMTGGTADIVEHMNAGIVFLGLVFVAANTLGLFGHDIARHVVVQR